MKRIVISNDNLSSKLPDFLHIKKSQYPDITVKLLLSLLHQQIPSLSPLLLGIRTIPTDLYLDFKLSNPSFPLTSLPLPISLIPILKQPSYLITSTTPLSLNYFTLLKHISSGTFSTVSLCSQNFNHHLLTLKTINKAHLIQNGQISQLKNQIQTLKYLRNIVWIPKLYYCFEDNLNVYVVMEYCPNGDLFLQLRKRGRFGQDEARVIFVQALWCLVVLREKGVVHADIKPENFVVDGEGYLKLADFGFAKKLLPDEKIKGLCGSYEYMAPEMIQHKQYSFPCDIYALGILLYQLLVGKTPFEGISKQNIKSVLTTQIKYPSHMSEQSKDLISQLTHRTPQKRLGAANIKDIFSHPWLSKHNNLINNILNRKEESVFYEMNVLKDVKPPSTTIQDTLSSQHKLDKPWGISYNYLTPTFDISSTKIGPKLLAHTQKQN